MPPESVAVCLITQWPPNQVPVVVSTFALHLFLPLAKAMNSEKWDMGSGLLNRGTSLRVVVTKLKEKFGMNQSIAPVTECCL